MNAAFLLMSTLAAGADTPPVAAAPAAPLFSAPAFGCGGCGLGGSCATGICGGASDPCPYGKPGLFTRLKNKLTGKKDECLPSKPVSVGFTTAACDSCGDSKPGLFGRLKAKFAGKHHNDGACDTLCGGCGISSGCCGSSPLLGGCALPPVPGTPVPAAPAAPPAPMPLPNKEGGAPAKNPISIPAVPLASDSRF